MEGYSDQKVVIKMSGKNKGPWYRNPKWLALIVVPILAAIIIGSSPLWTPLIRPPPADFSIAINPMKGAVQQGGVMATAITIEGSHGYEHQVSLSATGQPSGVVVTIVPSIGGPTPSYTSTVTITVGSNVPAGDYAIIIKGTGADGKEHSCSYTLTVKPLVTPTLTPTPLPTSPPTPTPKKVVNVPDAYYPSGWMGDWGDITLDDSCTDNPHSDPICIKITYSAARSQGKGWVGIYWQHPDNNWGDKIGGYDLTGATKLTFWAKGEKGEEKAEFKVGGITGKYSDTIQPAASTGVVVLSDKWQQYTIDLAGKDLSHIIGGFCWVTNKSQNPYGCTIYLDDIRFE